MKASKALTQDTKWIFIQKGTCSRTLFYILNREFGHPREEHEKAIDPLAGGILQQGYQCGQVWGAAMAVGAEAYRRCPGCSRAIGLAMTASRSITESFSRRTNTLDCFEIMGADWTKKGTIPKLLVTGKFLTCFKLADRWAPEAIETAHKSLSTDLESLPEHAVSCASEVVRRMGGTGEEIAMAAGLAGGVGLSGGGCGALAAAIWMKSLRRVRSGGKVGFPDTELNQFLKKFYERTDFQMLCPDITGRKFDSVEEHTDFIREGGCKELIDTLADGLQVEE